MAASLEVGGWVLGDSVYGADRRLRVMLEGRGQPYLTRPARRWSGR